MLYHYVADVDATHQQALATGAQSMVEPADMFYGDRHACVRDVSGNAWWIAARIEEVSLEEIQKRAIAFYHKNGQARSLITLPTRRCVRVFAPWRENIRTGPGLCLVPELEPGHPAMMIPAPIVRKSIFYAKTQRCKDWE